MADHHHEHSRAGKIKHLIHRLHSHNHHADSPSSFGHPHDPNNHAPSHPHHTNSPTSSWRSHLPMKSYSPSSSSRSSKRGIKDHSREADLSLELWNAAYDALRDHPSSLGLVTAYESIVSQELPDEVKNRGAISFRGCSADDRLQSFTDIMTAGLQKRRGSKGSNVDDVARKMLEQSKGTIESVWSAYPSAAVAWAGICTLTPLLLDPILRKDSMRKGIIHVTGRVAWYMHLSHLLLPNSWNDEQLFRTQQESTRETIIKLYRQVLELEMNCVCATASSWNNAAKNVVSWNSLDKLADSIDDTDASIRRCIEDYGTTALKGRLLEHDNDLDLVGASGEEAQSSQGMAGTTQVLA